MNNFSPEQVADLLRLAIVRSYGIPELQAQLKICQEILEKPMRVAVFGIMKAGKSTLINALFGVDEAPTGVQETTFNVSVFEYGQSGEVKVHYQDENRAPETRPESELKKLAVRDDSGNWEDIVGIQYIQVFREYEILKNFSLADTPGLCSTYGEDSDNAKRFIGRYDYKVAEATKQAAGSADAVIYLFGPKGLSLDDQKTIQSYQDSSAKKVEPINAIGVIARIDQLIGSRNEIDIFPIGSSSRSGNKKTPLAKGKEQCKIVMAEQARGLFYIATAVSAKLGWGAKTLTVDEWEILQGLASLSEDRMEELLIEDVDDFTTEETPDIPANITARGKVLQRLGQYGVWLSYQLIKNQGVAKPEILQQRLLEHSGLPELEELIVSHFGNQSYAIKLEQVKNRVASYWQGQGSNLTGENREIARKIVDEFDRLEQEQVLRELKLFGDVMSDRILGFSDAEKEEVKRVTGRYGASCAARLGFDSISSDRHQAVQSLDRFFTKELAEMQKLADERAIFWRKRANGRGRELNYTNAAGVLQGAYEAIKERLRESQRLLFGQ